MRKTIRATKIITAEHDQILEGLINDYLVKKNPDSIIDQSYFSFISDTGQVFISCAIHTLIINPKRKKKK
jgi:hypothetical protein